MKKINLFAFAALGVLLPCAIIGAGTRSLPVIRGRVVDPAGKPASAANVLVVSQERITKAVSDRHGRFSIELARPQKTFG